MSTVSFEGRLTIPNGNAMRRTLADALRPRPPELTIDLSGVTYIDTSGVATLVEAMRIAAQQGTRLVLAGVRGQPRYLFCATKFDQIFPIEEQVKT
jgi:anti-sigma B factor antagonist